MPNHQDIAVLFDLDGTLIDSSGDLASAANRMLDHLALPAVTLQQVEDWIGHGVVQLVNRCLTRSFDGVAETDLLDRGLALFRREYLQTGLVLTKVLPGARELLASLRTAGYRVGLVTNKDHVPTAAVLEAVDMADSFEVVVAGDTLPVRKPSPEPLDHALAELGLSSGWMIGDSETDARSSLSAGLPFIAVRGGYGRPFREGSLSGPPVLVVDSLLELLGPSGGPIEMLARPDSLSP